MHGLHGALTARAAGGSAPVRAGRADSPEGIWVTGEEQDVAQGRTAGGAWGCEAVTVSGRRTVYLCIPVTF